MRLACARASAAALVSLRGTQSSEVLGAAPLLPSARLISVAFGPPRAGRLLLPPHAGMILKVPPAATVSRATPLRRADPGCAA